MKTQTIFNGDYSVKQTFHYQGFVAALPDPPSEKQEEPESEVKPLEPNDQFCFYLPND